MPQRTLLPLHRAMSKPRSKSSKILKPLRSVGRVLRRKSQYGAVGDAGDVDDDLSGHADDEALLQRNLSTVLEEPNNLQDQNEIIDSVFYLCSRCLLLLFLLCAAFYLGTRLGCVSVAQKLLEFSAVSYGTCMLIIYVYRFHQCQVKKYATVARERRSLLDVDEEMDRVMPPALETQPSLALSEQPDEGNLLNDTYFIINSHSQQRVFCNEVQHLYPLDNDLFTGVMLVLIRTADMEDLDDSSLAAKHFLSKQRRFEFQFQIQLKRRPTSRVYFGCLLKESLQLGIVQRAFVTAAMAFVKKTNSNFHYTIYNETPIMAFPVDEGMNRVIITPPGQTPPTLGGDLEESAESLKLRKKGVGVEWNTTDVYTLSLWSAYVDFMDWQAMNLPGIRPLNLSNVIGSQPIHLILYEEGHSSAPIEDFEMSNARIGLGEKAKAYIRHNKPEMNEKDDDMSCIEDEEAISELGEGLYVESDQPYLLRDSSDGTCFLSYGGGFACMQKSSSYIVIAKKKGKHHMSRLIKSGDSVNFQLVTEGDKSIRYLSIHRGWWLKWTTTPPSKNGDFRIFASENSLDSNQRTASSGFITLGGSFWLQHRRWSKFMVGAAKDESAKYGGRLVGLYKSTDTASLQSGAFEDEHVEEFLDHVPEPVDGDEPKKGQWMGPLLLQVLESITPTPIPYQQVNESYDGDASVASELIDTDVTYSREGHKLDAPAWIEVLNRDDRVRQLVYALRVSPQGEDADGLSFIKLRKGSDLAEIMRQGRQWKANMHKESPFRRRRSTTVDSIDAFRPRQSTSSSPPQSPVAQIKSNYDTASIQKCLDDADLLLYVSSEESDWDEDDYLADDTELYPEGDSSATKPGKARKLVGKIAKSVTNRTKSTGKSVAKVGKGAVSAGKTIMARRPTNPPYYTEPRGKPSARSRRRAERDLHSAVGKSMKKRERYEGVDTESFAGELAAPDQSRMTVSKMLISMSGVSENSPLYANFNTIISKEIQRRSIFDAHFLQGGALQLGVTEPKGVIFGSVVARCIWDSHWREEWCCITDSKVSFFAPLSSSPCLDIALEDIRVVRSLAENNATPLRGFPVLVVETAWICHYIAVSSEDCRFNLSSQLKKLVSTSQSQFSITQNLHTDELTRARFWQGLQVAGGVTAGESSHGRSKWADISSGNKVKRRIILNSRRAVFDLPCTASVDLHFLETLLQTCLAFDPDLVRENPEPLVEFLDATSRLQLLCLADLDFNSPSVFCMFTNLYHCLLQHAMLISINGRLSKNSCMHFMRTSCYEIGGDVFSLAEISACVIRGKMARAIGSKPPYVEPPRKSNGYRMYGLGYTDVRVNFVLHTGNKSYPQEVPVLSPANLEAKMGKASQRFIRRNFRVDTIRKIIHVPKVFDYYRGDFEIDSTQGAFQALKFCIPFLDRETMEQTDKLVKEETALVVKFESLSETYYSYLTMDVSDDNPGDIAVI